MDKIQLQIQEIDNGWLVQVPGRQNQISGHQIMPKCFFCSDYNDVVNCLKQLWPKEMVQ